MYLGLGEPCPTLVRNVIHYWYISLYMKYIFSSVSRIKKMKYGTPVLYFKNNPQHLIDVCIILFLCSTITDAHQ